MIRRGPATRRRLHRVSLLACAALLVGGCSCAGSDGGRDLASGWRGLMAIRGAPLGEPVSLPRAPFADAVFRGRIESNRLAESSGLARSRLAADRLWSINDSGRKPRLYAFGTDGRDLGFVLVEAADAVDWESLAGFEWKGRPHLLIADTGDNTSWHRHSQLLIVEEPALASRKFAREATVPVAWRLRFRYEDGPRDCEAVAVDPAGARVLLLSKRDIPPALYELPLAPPKDPDALLVARRIGTVPGIPPPTEDDVRESRWLGRYRSMPTGLDVSDDGRLAAVVTYKDAYLFRRALDETWAAALARTPEWIPLPPLRQAEAIAFDDDDRSLFVTSEKRPTPLFHLPWVDATAP